MNQVQFSVAAHAAWAPNLVTHQAWREWANTPSVTQGENEPSVSAMPSMLRRRASFLGKMALEVAYQCLGNPENERHHTPTVFCSRHGDVARAMELLLTVVKNEPVSPTNFGLTVHNATAGLFSIARKDQANHIALSAGQSTVEHGVIEACGLLADGADQVLLVNYDTCLPALFSPYEDCVEQPHAWAWLIVPRVPAAKEAFQLSWQQAESAAQHAMPASLQVLQFYLRGDALLERYSERRKWSWSRCA
jgi:hypothetical protein